VVAPCIGAVDNRPTGASGVLNQRLSIRRSEPTLGLLTILQPLPEVCSISVRVVVPVLYVPTAQQSVLEAHATALNIEGNPGVTGLLYGCAVTGPEDDEPDGPPHAANRSPVARTVPAATAVANATRSRVGCIAVSS
jgi:hypothetical protein